MSLVVESKIMNVVIFLYDGVEIFDFSGFGEVFVVSYFDGGGFWVYMVVVIKVLFVSQGFVYI